MRGKVGPPLVIDLGKLDREDVGELVSGAGKVLDDIDMAMNLVCQHIEVEGDVRVLLPVVVVYTEADADRVVVKTRKR